MGDDVLFHSGLLTKLFWIRLGGERTGGPEEDRQRILWYS